MSEHSDSSDSESNVSRPRSTSSSSNAIRAIRNSGVAPQSHLETLILRAAEFISLKTLLEFVKNGNLVRLAKVVTKFIKAHRRQILGVLGLVVGIVLIANPLAMAGFGAVGPILGSAAAAWQAAIGNVAAGSLFAMLQSAGMLYAVAIPVVGSLVVGGSAVGLAHAVGALRPACEWVKGTAGRVWQWMKGKEKSS
ncbi:hypothetical protein FB45DRAFT_859608 [Roridomyces roridus]|uniref:Uncharacterized protein n=1 Tax=Roridomyces roridus TaxID=1738132 RepID=A0AAD7FZC4_9AGAR|nr:hypothetical protein FB45DRAFT_859608 [Roridomyces roridus]